MQTFPSRNCRWSNVCSKYVGDSGQAAVTALRAALDALAASEVDTLDLTELFAAR